MIRARSGGVRRLDPHHGGDAPNGMIAVNDDYNQRDHTRLIERLTPYATEISVLAPASRPSRSVSLLAESGLRPRLIPVWS